MPLGLPHGTFEALRLCDLIHLLEGWFSFTRKPTQRPLAQRTKGLYEILRLRKPRRPFTRSSRWDLASPRYQEPATVLPIRLSNVGLRG